MIKPVLSSNGPVWESIDIILVHTSVLSVGTLVGTEFQKKPEKN